MPERTKDSGQNDKEQSFQPFEKKQKVALIILSFLSLFILLFWFFQFRGRINNPFRYDNKPGADNLCVGAGCFNNPVNSDIDQDGLLDSDELNLYGTSPYLSDSDSDGWTDLQEVQAGSDPNCPMGSSCDGSVDFIDYSNNDYGTGVNLDLSAYDDSGLATDENQILTGLLTGQIDSNTLRELLMASGSISEEDLNLLSDEDLIAAYQEMFNK